MKKASKIGFTILLAAVFTAGFALHAAASEHPAEHPSGGHDAREHPKAGPVISKDALADAIEAYAEKDAALKGGYFLVYDKQAKQPLALTLDRVHRERLSKVKDNVYFLCVDFKTPSADTYDLDIFMEGSNAKSLKTTQILVHKKNGKERYTWYEESGVWKRKPVK